MQAAGRSRSRKRGIADSPRQISQVHRAEETNREWSPGFPTFAREARAPTVRGLRVSAVRRAASAARDAQIRDLARARAVARRLSPGVAQDASCNETRAEVLGYRQTKPAAIPVIGSRVSRGSSAHEGSWPSDGRQRGEDVEGTMAAPSTIDDSRGSAATAAAYARRKRQRCSRSVVAPRTRTARYRVGRILHRASRSSRSAVKSRSSSSARSSARTALTSRSRKPRWRRPAKTLVCASTIRGATAWP
jgi:hypothetical protein